MIIKKASIGDFERLKKIKSEFYLLGCKVDPRSRPEWAERALGPRLGKNLKQSNIAFFIAMDNKNILGYTGIRILKLSKEFKKEKQGEIFNLYVIPEYRNKGIAKKLLKESFKWFKSKNISDISVKTRYHNKIARNLYRKMGFNEDIVEFIK